MEDYWEADNELNVKLDRAIQDAESPEKQDVNAAPIVPGLSRPTWRRHKQGEKVSMTINAIDMRRNKGNTKK